MRAIPEINKKSMKILNEKRSSATKQKIKKTKKNVKERELEEEKVQQCL